MLESWRTFLQDSNAVIENDQVVHFDNRLAELKQVQNGTILVDLSHYGLLRFSGVDVQTFLQNQLSCDVREVTENQGQYGSYCTPKGRVLASFILWQKDDAWIMQLPASLCAGMQKKLSMFILRAKVNITDSSNQWVRMGIAGKEACQRLQEVLEISPEECAQLRMIHTSDASILCHAPDRLELIAIEASAHKIWQLLSKNACPAGAGCWNWLEINAGIPAITVETQEQFLPQMINLDLIGGVSFKKGCYPGQEIVARTQHLGQLKRRMYLANIGTNDPVSAGDDIFGTDAENQSCGKIVNAAASPDGGFDVLAVIQISSVDAGKLYLKYPDGPELHIRRLPYSPK
ncbi:MAG: folate-binding protein [Nitrosomonas sp.]|nr:folate-binding protein [Nitrosomonas sp.]